MATTTLTDKMLIRIFPSNSRGVAEHGWLHSRFSYSFAEYYNKDRIHFGALRVLNDDVVEPGMGFGMHPHDNMEIITIPLSGSLEHKDSMGNGSVIKAGDIQVMSAGTGIRHSEFNPSETEPVSLFQIWIFPKVRNIKPRYDQVSLDIGKLKNNFQVVVGPSGSQADLHINQDAYLSLGHFDANKEPTYELKQPGNGLYAIVIKGEAEIGGKYVLRNRDAAEITGYNKVDFKFKVDTELLLIEVPMM